MGVQQEQPDAASAARETAAMLAVSKALEVLTPDERRRVLAWARRFAGPVMRCEVP